MPEAIRERPALYAEFRRSRREVVTIGPMGLRSAFPIVYCDDLSRSLRFYRDLLGFEVTFAFPDQGDYVEDPRAIR